MSNQMWFWCIENPLNTEILKESDDVQKRHANPIQSNNLEQKELTPLLTATGI